MQWRLLLREQSLQGNVMPVIHAKQFSQVMRDLARVPAQASRAIAKDISKEIQRNFARGVDPYGEPWRELADSTRARGRHEPPLTDTGAGKRSVKVAPLASAGIRITVSVFYMVYHQFGGKSHLRGGRRNPRFGTDTDRSTDRENPPRRSFLPFDALPRAWGEIILARLEEMARKRVSRG